MMRKETKESRQNKASTRSGILIEFYSRLPCPRHLPAEWHGFAWLTLIYRILNF